MLGCLIDFISIMLLTVPIFAPIATHLGLFAWIQWQRRILVRWKYHTPNFLGFVQLACLLSSSGDFELGSSDIVTISTEKIGALVNRVRLSPDCPSCTYGVRHLMWDLGSKDLI
jgi:TRAP-type mannitol/chloroaromatic compound transport system permease large subunit